MTMASDDDMIVQGDANGLSRVAHLQGHGDIGLGRGGVAGGVVVHDAIENP